MNDIKQQEDYKYFIILILTAFISISVLFTYAYLYIEDERVILNHKIEGLNKITSVQNVIFDLQNLRGLSNIVSKDNENLANIQTVKDTLKQKALKMQDLLKNTKANTHLKEQFIDFSNQTVEHTQKINTFDELSKSIEKAMLFIEQISYHANITLDSQLKSYILTQTIILTLPRLLEYNGQIRGISSGISNNKLTQEQQQNIIILESKIKDNITQLKFDIVLLQKDMNINDSYIATIKAQNNLLHFVDNQLLNQDNVVLNSNNIFKLISTNINHIKKLYIININILEKILQDRVADKNMISKLIIISGIWSMIFILYMNYVFFTKNRKFIKEIQMLSITDGMTKLYNRRHFDNEFEKQLKIQKRLEHNLVFVIMDIDHFKQYNDTYGHQAGDKTLIAVANSLTDDLHRPNDMVFRLGGEEFGVLCSNMSEDEAVRFANRLRINIEALHIKHEGNSASKYVTISMGLVTIIPECTYNVDDLYKYADSALYDAKKTGRNNVLACDFTAKV